jgi:transmembrane sensor
MNKPVNKEAELLFKYWNNQLSEQEERDLEAWANESDRNRRLLEKMKDDGLRTELDIFQESDSEALWNKIVAADPELQEGTEPTIRSIWWPRMAAAAAVIVIVASTLILLNRKSTKPNTDIVSQKKEVKQDVPPGQFKARLTLADGSTVILDSVSDGKTIQQGSIAVKNTNGQLVYDTKAKTSEVLFNTLTTGKGESYQLALADGSKVWLNAASSIRFPVSFTGNDRKVEITGEAYFEVAPVRLRSGQKMPFKVFANDVEVQVLGTEFNINTYTDEPGITTTLVEGKVQITKGGKSTALTPGQQAQITSAGDIKVDANADVEKAIGWKNGLFIFNGDDLKSVMKQIARWYDVQVVYKGDYNDRIYAMMRRDQPASVALEIIGKSSKHFKIENRTIYVIP